MKFLQTPEEVVQEAVTEMGRMLIPGVNVACAIVKFTDSEGDPQKILIQASDLNEEGVLSGGEKTFTLGKTGFRAIDFEISVNTTVSKQLPPGFKAKLKAQRAQEAAEEAARKAQEAENDLDAAANGTTDEGQEIPLA